MKEKSEILENICRVGICIAGIWFYSLNPVARGKLVTIGILTALGLKFPKFGGVLAASSAMAYFMVKK